MCGPLADQAPTLLSQFPPLDLQRLSWVLTTDEPIDWLVCLPHRHWEPASKEGRQASVSPDLPET